MLRLFSCVILILTYANVSAQEKRFNFTQPKMGSPFTITFYHSDTILANQLANNCFLLVDSLVAIYSDYIDSSELNRLSATSGQGRFVTVTPALYKILLYSQRAYLLSEKTFDISVGPLTRFWRKARKETRFPELNEILEKKKAVGFDKIKFDTITKTVCLTQPGMQLDLGGIAQGYIAQKVLERLQQYNIHIALINVSGDIAIGNPPPGKSGWSIGINVPQQEEKLLNKKLLLYNCAVSTSGDVYQFFEHNGKRYSHIIDPRTGYGITTPRNVTVIAKDATTADWLATACSILPIHKSKRLAKQLNAEVLIGVIKKGKMHFYQTKRFRDYWQHNE